MIRSAKPEATELNSLELTPLLDIVFIVVVFLLLTANAPLLKLSVDIPEAPKSASLAVAEPDSLVISIQKDEPVWMLEGNRMSTWAEFESTLLERLTPNRSISIATDKSASAENLVKVMSFLNAQAMANVQIVMESAN